MNTLRFALACLFTLPSCGYEIVEFAPKRDRGEEVEIIGFSRGFPDWAFEQFKAEKEERKSSGKLELKEPADDSALPVNLTPIPISWTSLAKAPPPSGSGPMSPDAPPDPAAPRAFYELTLSGNQDAVRLYTIESSATLPSEHWQALLRAHENQTLTLELRGLSDEPKAKVQRTTRKVKVAPATARGSLYLETRERGLTASLDSGEVTAVDALALPSPEQALDPMGARLATIRAGQLEIVRVADGVTLSRLAAAEGSRLADPAWAPDGRALAVTISPGGAGAMAGSSIARVSLDAASQLGALELVAEAAAGQSFQRPAFAPDGSWLAFEGSAEPDGSGSAIFVAASLSSPPKRLHAPEGSARRGEHSPCWIPSERADYAFVAFVSDRLPDREGPRSGSQLWLQGIEFRAGKADEIRSARPLALSFEGVTDELLRLSWISAEP